MMRFAIGCHITIAGGYARAAHTAAELGGDTFQFFTSNPRGGKAKAVDVGDLAAMKDFLTAHDFAPLIAHAPYTMNLCSAKEDVRAFGRDMLRADLERLSHIPGHFYNFHPGSHTGQGIETAIAQIAEALGAVLPDACGTTILLETMAGKGTEVGGRFEELRAVLDRLPQDADVGVCLDTCHVHDAGYDIVNDPDGVLTQFDKIIGLERLHAVHLNDSKKPAASRKDRHEQLGRGTIGEEALRRMVQHPALRELPFILETPNDNEGYRREIALVRRWRAEV